MPLTEGRTSIPIGRIGAIKLAQQRRPGEVAVTGAAARFGLHPLVSIFENSFRRIDQFGVAGQCHHLHLAGTLEPEQHIERRRHGATDDEQAVVAQGEGGRRYCRSGG